MVVDARKLVVVLVAVVVVVVAAVAETEEESCWVAFHLAVVLHKSHLSVVACYAW